MVTWEKQLTCCTLPQPSENSSVPPEQAPGDWPRAVMLLLGKEQLSCAAFPWKRDFSLGHTLSELFKLSHNHAFPSPLPVRAQSLTVAGLVRLGKIKDPFTLCEKSRVDLKPGIVRFGGIPTDQRSHTSCS